MTGPDEGVARSHLRAAHADREHVIAILKEAFVQDRLDRDELGARVGQALASRTYAELAALTADLPARAAVAEPTRKPAGTMAKASYWSGACVLAAVALAEGALLNAASPVGAILFFFAVMMVTAALGVFGYGIVDARAERKSQRQVPPQSGERDRGLERGWTGHDRPYSESRIDQTRTDLRIHRSGQGRRYSASRGVPVPGAV